MSCHSDAAQSFPQRGAKGKDIQDIMLKGTRLIYMYGPKKSENQWDNKG